MTVENPSATETPHEPTDNGTARGANGGEANELETLRKELEAARGERDAFQTKWLRAEADLDNYRRRANKEMDEERRYRALAVARDLLEPLDNLNRTVEAGEKSGDAAQLVQGLKMVLKLIDDAFAKHAVVPMLPVGKPFDPNWHQALSQVPHPDYPPMTVIAELQRGYTLHDRVVRPSTVIVSTAPPTPESPAVGADGSA